MREREKSVSSFSSCGKGATNPRRKQCLREQPRGADVVHPAGPRPLPSAHRNSGLPGESDNTELVLGSAAIPESGTASVRARPTVKHHSSSSESFQGFAVPTPKVPLLPPVNGPKINGSVSGGQLSNGSVLSVAEHDEDDIFVPPHPSVAPPPPPGTFIIPPPDFMGDLSTLQAPSVPFSNPTTQAPYVEDNLAALKPPPMSPPKPPTTNGPASPGPIASPTGKVPDRPKFAPPQPPTLQYKTPPPKPVRLSSISMLDSPPQTPAPPPPVQTPTLSTFNPQNTAKLYDVPKTSILGGYQDVSTKPKQMILLEDSTSVKPVPVLAQVDGKAPQAPTPSKPISKDIQELKEDLQITKPSPAPPPEPKEAKTVSVPPVVKPPRITQPPSPQLPKLNNPTVNLDSSKLDGSSSQSRRFSPLLDHKLRSLKSSETNTAGHTASPLALLMAAKERDKHRTTHSLSRENSHKKDEQPSVIIQPSETSPNSFIITPRSSSSSSLTSQGTLQESPRSFSPVTNTQTIKTPEIPRSPALAKIQPSSPSLALSKLAASPSPTNPVVQNPNAEQSLPKIASIQNGDDKEEISPPFLPPPPEFDDFDGVMGPPPSMPPPDPPIKKSLVPSLNLIPKAPVPSPPTKPKPPAAPNLPPPDFGVKPKPTVQGKPKMVPNQLPSNLSPSQATLLSILQKKMLEMDHKVAQENEGESGSDDWGSPLSDEENKVPVIPKVSSPQSKTCPVVKSPVVKSPVVNQAATVDMRELEGKMAKKHQESSSVKVPVSNGQQSKHQYGMTFTVRPGTKQPITLVRKGEP